MESDRGADRFCDTETHRDLFFEKNLWYADGMT